MSREGVGVHTGSPCTALVQPAEWGSGIVFQTQGGKLIPAVPWSLASVSGMTALKSGRYVLGMIEHLMSALYAHGITDATVVVFGPEVPILDGSAVPWCDAIDQAGVESGREVRPIVITEKLQVELGDGWATAEPADVCEVGVHVDFGPALKGSASVVLDPEGFRSEVAWARTFAMERDIERLREAGRGAGSTLENTVVVRNDGSVLNPGGERAGGECVRHKLLDAIGDLALLGRPLRGRVQVHRGTHALHHSLVHRIRAEGG